MRSGPLPNPLPSATSSLSSHPFDQLSETIGEFDLGAPAELVGGWHDVGPGRANIAISILAADDWVGRAADLRHRSRHRQEVDGAPTTDDVSITVIDGAIENAVVCLDKNGNGACDSDEPTGRTDAAGKVTLKVDKADTGKFPVLVIAGTDARDADTGLVPVAFTLKAPADKTALVSPLTTLVQTVIEGSGLSSAAAEIQIKDQAAV